MKGIAVKIKKTTYSKVTYKLEIPRNLQKYFRKRYFSICYNTQISSDPALLLIPATGMVLPIAMVAKIPIILSYIDKTFLIGINKLSEIIRTMYPPLKFEGIHATKIKDVKVNGSNVAVFYSGGVDSTALLLRHLQEKPYLITIRGSDIPIWDDIQWESVKKLAKQTGEIFNCSGNIFITFENPLNLQMLGEDFSEVLNSKDWWGKIQAGVTIPTLAAPLVNVLKLRRIYIASDIPEKIDIPWSDRSSVFNSLAFGDCKIISDDGDLSRIEKVGIIKRELIKHGYENIPLRSCLNPIRDPTTLNCGYCEKCVRTILELLICNLDPAKFGFKTDLSKISELIKTYIHQASGAKKIYWSEIIEEARKIDPKTLLEENKKLILNLQQFNLNEVGIESYGKAFHKNFYRGVIYRKLMRLYYNLVPLSIRDPFYSIEDKCYAFIIKVLRRKLWKEKHHTKH